MQAKFAAKPWKQLEQVKLTAKKDRLEKTNLKS